jgi:uncharacterized metal-binding protein YceD (DUF177 family)
VQKELRKYEIQIQGLADGAHEFEYEVDNKFFEAFEQDMVDAGEFKVLLELNKSATMLQLDFNITGNVELVCDRSLDKFTQEMSAQEIYIYKFGETRKVVAEDMEIIPFGVPEINVAQLIFDFVALSVPIKKLHPRYNEDEDEGGYVVYSTKAEATAKPKEGTEEKSEDKEENIDPRWAALKSLKK